MWRNLLYLWSSSWPFSPRVPISPINTITKWWSILLSLNGTKLRVVSARSLNYFYCLKIMIIVSNLLFVPIRLWSNLILCIFGPLNKKCTDKNIWTLKPTALKPISLFWYDFIKLNILTFIKLRKILLLFSNLNRPKIKFSDVNQWLFSFLDYGIAFK